MYFSYRFLALIYNAGPWLFLIKLCSRWGLHFQTPIFGSKSLSANGAAVVSLGGDPWSRAHPLAVATAVCPVTDPPMKGAPSRCCDNKP